MTGYTPEQLPVTSALARGFATFDHWFCEVPSQTFANRSFFHAGTSSGFVVNVAPAESFPVHDTAETQRSARAPRWPLTWASSIRSSAKTRTSPGPTVPRC